MRLVVIDGYNVLATADPYRRLLREDRDTARAALVNDVASRCAGACEARIVFDGAANPRSDGTPHVVAGVTVQFSAFGHDADEVIERFVMDRRSTADEVVVVTSDAQTQWVALGSSVRRMSSLEFAGEIASGNAESREHARTGSSSSTVGERVDEDTRLILSRRARESSAES
jgi:predicted RNA-binding protein with PIN domain